MQPGQWVGRALRWIETHPTRAALLVIALYLPAAALSLGAAIPDEGLLRPPFLPAAGHAYTAYPAIDVAGAALELTEDGRPLGPANSLLADVNVLGEGRYCLQPAPRVLTFSASDNSDPNQNGRLYRLRKALPSQLPATFR